MPRCLRPLAALIALIACALLAGPTRAQTLVRTIDPPDEGALFGLSVHVSGDQVLVGHPGGDPGNGSFGVAHLYDLATGAKRHTFGSPLAGASGVGRAGGLAGGRALVSSYGTPDLEGWVGLYSTGTGALLQQLVATNSSGAMGQGLALTATRAATNSGLLFEPDGPPRLHVFDLVGGGQVSDDGPPGTTGTSFFAGELSMDDELLAAGTSTLGRVDV